MKNRKMIKKEGTYIVYKELFRAIGWGIICLELQRGQVGKE